MQHRYVHACSVNRLLQSKHNANFDLIYYKYNLVDTGGDFVRK